jgi:hypothetical protein
MKLETLRRNRNSRVNIVEGEWRLWRHWTDIHAATYHIPVYMRAHGFGSFAWNHRNLGLSFKISCKELITTSTRICIDEVIHEPFDHQAKNLYIAVHNCFATLLWLDKTHRRRLLRRTAQNCAEFRHFSTNPNQTDFRRTVIAASQYCNALQPQLVIIERRRGAIVWEFRLSSIVY